MSKGEVVGFRQKDLKVDVEEAPGKVGCEEEEDGPDEQEEGVEQQKDLQERRRESKQRVVRRRQTNLRTFCVDVPPRSGLLMRTRTSCVHATMNRKQ